MEVTKDMLYLAIKGLESEILEKEGYLNECDKREALLTDIYVVNGVLPERNQKAYFADLAKVHKKREEIENDIEQCQALKKKWWLDYCLEFNGGMM